MPDIGDTISQSIGTQDRAIWKPRPPEIFAREGAGSAAAASPAGQASPARPATPFHYRPDIDGLRALSVLSVILFHAGFEAIPGGFVAVDVFFVISGFLITQIMLRDHEKRRFSILTFYDRRVRRIVPALCAVVAGTIIAGAVLLLPSEFEKLGRSAVAAGLFATNILFWRETTYFAADVISQPLLHSWTLAVEEQFYIVWPVVIALLFRFRLERLLKGVVLAGILISLAAAEAMVHHSMRTAFYMFPFRAWELLIGAALACWRLPLPSGRLIRELYAGIGLALLLGSMMLLTEAMIFPGITALPVCLGTAMLIHSGSGERTLVGRILACPPLVGIGLISYSTYLVHWPIISIWMLNSDETLSTAQGLVALAASLALGGLLWRYVELPFRTATAAPVAEQLRPHRPRLSPALSVASGAAALLLLAGAGSLLVKTNGFPARLPASAAMADAFHQVQPYKKLDCRVDDRMPGDLSTCLFAHDPGRQARTLLWGDSHALHLVDRFRDAYAARGERLLIASASGCNPLPGVLPAFGHGRTDDRCRAFNDQMLALIEANPQIRRVVVSGHWGAFHSPSALQPGRNPQMRYLLDSVSSSRSAENNIRAFRDSLERLAGTLQARGVQLVLIGQSPIFRQRVPTCLARAIWNGGAQDRCSLSRAEMTAELRDVAPVLRTVAAHHGNVVYYDPIPRLCPDGTCSGTRDGRILIWDTHHLTTEGSRIALAGLRIAQP